MSRRLVQSDGCHDKGRGGGGAQMRWSEEAPCED